MEFHGKSAVAGALGGIAVGYLLATLTSGGTTKVLPAKSASTASKEKKQVEVEEQTRESKGKPSEKGNISEKEKEKEKGKDSEKGKELAPRAKEQALAARQASRLLQSLPNEARAKLLMDIATALESRKDEILAANAKDIAAAKEMKMAQSLRDRLVLSEKKLKVLAEGVRQIASGDDPINKTIRNTRLATGLTLSQITVPIGVLLVIFESRPDCLPQIAALSLRSGNGVVLKGGSEAKNSNACLHSVITDAIIQSQPALAGSVCLVESRDDIASLLKLDHLIDLVIPRGSGELVKHIQQNTHIPVMGHSEGICHVYVDEFADTAKAIKLVVDSKTDYPAACNAMETLLIHRRFPDGDKLVEALSTAGVELFGGPRAHKQFNLPLAPTFKHEYSSMGATIEIIESMEEAIDHIHTYGSAHTELIITEKEENAKFFISHVDAACVFHNASTRFADGYRLGLGAEVGISTGRLHARGPVGVDGLTSTKWVLLSEDAHTAGEFSSGARTFLHQRLAVE